MKNIIKTIVYGFSAVILFGLSATPVLANAVFNNHPSDFDTIRVSNFTDFPGSNSNWTSAISADAGDIVSVAIYYHNNGTQTANSTKIKINNGPNIGSAFTHTISGSVSAVNAGTVSGSAIFNLTSSQTLTYIPGSVRWYPNQSTTNSTPLPFGQNGTEIFSASGLNIGTIAQGWPSQGSVVLQYQVSETQTIQNPIVTTNSATNVSQNQATLNGFVNGQGNNPYTWFVYGTSSNLGAGSLTTGQDYQSFTSGNFSETVSVNSNTTYYFKACALVNGGATICGSTLSFFTGTNAIDVQLPNVVTNNATGVSYYSATLNGAVTDMGNANSVYSLKFEYGTNSGNLNQTAFASQSSLNNPGSFSAQVSNLSSNTTYYFRACGTNGAGQDCGNIFSFTTDNNNNDNDNDNIDLEVQTLTAQSVTTQSAVLRGDIEETSGEEVIRYFEYGEDDDDLDYTLVLPGTTDNEGQFQALVTGLQAGETYYFRACIEAEDSNDEDCGNIRNFTTDGGNWYQPPVSTGTLQAITSFATGISSNSAVLNGVSINSTSNGTISYFQYGTTPSLGLSTSTKSVNSGQTLYNAQAISGLVPNTTYYYRIVTGGVLGNVSTFKTSTNQTVVVTNVSSNTTTNTSVNTNTGGAGIIYLALDITPDFENVYQGDVVNFDVDYRNLYNGDLEDVVIQVMFPEEIEFRKSTAGFYSAPNRALIVDLGDLDNNEEGTFLVQAEILGRFNNRDSVITIAEGTYDHPTISNAQGSSTAYALNTILIAGSTLGAFAFGAGFLPGIFGWLILILLLLLIVWISRKIYMDHYDRKNEKQTLQIN